MTSRRKITPEDAAPEKPADDAANGAEEIEEDRPSDAEPDDADDPAVEDVVAWNGEEAELAAEAAAEIDPRDAEITDLKDKLLRTLAENENVRRRAARDVEEARRFAVSRFATDLCEVADNLYRAIDSASEDMANDDAVKSLLDGVKMTANNLLSVFERHGIRPIDPKGERFDPNLHEAMTEIEFADAEPGTVIEVFQTGYLINDRLLRPARVVVARAPREQAGEDTSDAED